MVAGTIDITDLTIIDSAETPANEGDADATFFGGTSYSGIPQREGTACEGGQASEGALELSGTLVTSIDLSASSIHGWMLLWGSPDTFANVAFGIVLGDGTNRRAYAVGGTGTPDIQGVFLKNGWVSFQLNCASLPTDFVQLDAGSTAPTLTAITEVGYYFDAISKVLGKVDNAFVDIMYKYANANYPARIEQGDSTTPATFSDLSDDDFDDAADKAYGILYQSDAGVFQLQAPIAIGENSTLASYFESINEEVIFIDKPVGRQALFLAGNATGQNEFYVTGTVFRNVNSSLVATLDWSDTNFEYVQIDACTFIGDIDLILPPSSVNRFCNNSVFDGCGQIDPNTCEFEFNTIRNSVDGATGALLLDASGSANWSDLSFSKDPAVVGHAIYITATGSYTFTNFTYSGYELTGTEATVYNNSGGAVTITVSGGDTPSVRNGAGASTTVISSRTLTINGGTASSAERLGVYLSKGVGSTEVEKEQYTSHATNNTAASNTFEISITIPADTPATGTIKLLQKNPDGSVAREDTHTYTSFSGAIFSGISPVLAVTYDSSDKAFVPYIEKTITADPETYAYSYVSTRNIVSVWRKKGFLEDKQATTLPDADSSLTIQKRIDRTVNLP